MKHTQLLCLSALLAVPGSLSAATITYAGAISGNEVARWRTDSVAKSFDLDGDNVYGSFGAVNWVDGDVGGSTVSTDLGFSVVSAGAQYQQAAYDDIDSLSSPGTMTDAGISLQRFTIVFKGLDADYTNQVLRLGVMQGVLGGGEAAKDFGKRLTVIEVDTDGNEVSGGGNSGEISIRGGAVETVGNVDMLFFDISGVEAGDRFEVYSENPLDANAIQGYNSAFSIDMVAVPEPSSSSLLALAGMSVILRRKR